MTPSLRNLLLALGGASAAAGGGYLWWLRKQIDDADPATPLPELPPPVLSPTIEAPALDSNEVEALARVISSEAGNETPLEQKAIGWTVRNRFRGKSIYQGEFPWRAQKGSNPPFSSARDSKDSHRILAKAILSAPQSDDPTGGATAFFEPRMQDIFAKAGEMARNGETGSRVIDGVKLSDITRFKNYHKNADEIRAKWSPGSALYATAGKFELWGSANLLAKRGGTSRIIVGYVPSDIPLDDVTLLARAIESSASKGTSAEKQAIAWTCRNRAKKLNLSLRQLLCPQNETGPRGSGGRAFCSTEAKPSMESLAIAKAVLWLPQSADPTRGAVDFWYPEQQAHLARTSNQQQVKIPNTTETRKILNSVGLRTCALIGRLELLSI